MTTTLANERANETLRRPSLRMRLGAQPRRTAAWVVGVAALLTVGVVFGLPHAQAWHDLRLARHAVNFDRLEDLRQRMEGCTATWPNSGEAHYVLARLCRRLDDFEAAGRHLAEARRLGFAAEILDHELLLLTAQSGDIQTVEQTLVRQVEAGHHDELLILEALVKGYLRLHYLPEARRWATLWLQWYPDDWQPYYHRARSIEQLFQSQSGHAARQDYERVLQLRPDHEEARWRLGDMLTRLGQTRQALPHLRIQYAKYPQDPYISTTLARCLRDLGEIDEARAVLDVWLNNEKREHPNILLVRGMIALDQEKPQEAKDWLKRCEKLTPKEDELLTTLAIVYRQLGETEEAEKYDRRAKDMYRQVERLRNLYQMISRNPEDPDLKNEAGTTLIRIGREQDGVRLLLQVLQMDPLHKPTQYSLADYYEATGKPELAAKYRVSADRGLPVIVNPEAR